MRQKKHNADARYVRSKSIP